MNLLCALMSQDYMLLFYNILYMPHTNDGVAVGSFRHPPGTAHFGQQKIKKPVMFDVILAPLVWFA